MLNISSGIVIRPQKVVIYGPEGIGKTTLAAKMPDPLFIDTEGGSAYLDVRRIDRPEEWEELLSIVHEVAATDGICRTLVLDTADWAEQLAIKYILKKYGQDSIEAFGYGKGYTYIGEEFGRLLSALDSVIDAGMNVTVTAHAKMRKFEQPDEMGAYDRWEMKLSRQSAPLLKEWCDMLLFCNYETYVVNSENNTAKAQGGKRVMYTSHHPCWDAKNRNGLPEKVELDYRYLAPIFAATSKGNPGNHAKTVTAGGEGKTQIAPLQEETTEEKRTALCKVQALLTADGIAEEDLRRFVAEKGHYQEDTPVSEYTEKFLAGWVIRYWPRIREIIRKEREKAGKIETAMTSNREADIAEANDAMEEPAQENTGKEDGRKERRDNG